MPVRIARSSDAPKLAALAERTFIDTFSASNTKEDMALHCQSSYSPEHQRREIENPQWITLVCECDGELAGYAQLRWEEFPACVIANKPGEILCFYIEKNWHGRGLAQQLMHACLNALKSGGFDAVWLGVWEHNPRAIAFYQKFGFTEAGEHIFQLGSDPQRDIILTRTL
ncbi:spermidine/spermine N(1)-acetyltransferase [Salmonella enterica subsp. enterica serovar Choleraesuis]|nr:spermidine/spermine N(1)-acetyltransferase [Salmonella enterica subsp. enterica serovar Choleraesuis]